MAIWRKLKTSKVYQLDENILFILILIMESLLVLSLIITHRIPSGHDGFGLFSLQYYFLNNAVMHHEIPQWMPYMTQGTVSNWWYAVQSNILQNAATIISEYSNLFKPVNFITIFHLGIFFDELILLVGSWLLAKRFYTSPFAIFFVCLNVLGSVIWMHQTCYNLHLYYAIPLILHFGHSFLESGKWIHLFLSGNLLVLQFLGNLPYFIPITTLIIFIYFFFYLLFNLNTHIDSIQQLKFGLSFQLCIAGIMLCAIAVYYLLKVQTDFILNYNIGRSIDTTVPLPVFLSYGGEITNSKWLEVLSGVSPSLDNTLYFGLLSVPLAIFGFFFYIRRDLIHIHLLILFLLFFCSGGLVSSMSYYGWPFMKYYRHIGLLSSITRIFLCFLTGFGFEFLFITVIKRSELIVSAIAAISMMLLGIWLWFLSQNENAARYFIESFGTLMQTQVYTGNNPNFPSIFDVHVLCQRLFHSCCISFVAAFIILFSLLVRQSPYRSFLLITSLLLASYDIYSYKQGESILRTISIPEGDLIYSAFTPLPYRQRRAITFYEDNQRVSYLLRNKPFIGVINWHTNNFAFVDEVGSTFRVDSWLLPLDNYMRTYWGQDIYDLNACPLGHLPGSNLDFPLEQESIKKLSGVINDKIQFFSKAYIFENDRKIALAMKNPNYKGDMLFLSHKKDCVIPQQDQKKLIYTNQPLQENCRINVSCSIERFDSNTIVINVQNLTDNPIWLLYADVWHAGWNGTINGLKTDLYKGNLAYKALCLKAGENRVEMKFALPMVSFIYFFIGLNSIAWVCIAGIMIIKIITGSLADEKDKQHSI